MATLPMQPVGPVQYQHHHDMNHQQLPPQIQQAQHNQHMNQTHQYMQQPQQPQHTSLNHYAATQHQHQMNSPQIHHIQQAPLTPLTPTTMQVAQSQQVLVPDQHIQQQNHHNQQLVNTHANLDMHQPPPVHVKFEHQDQLQHQTPSHPQAHHNQQPQQQAQTTPANQPRPRGRRKKIRTEPVRPICPQCEKQFSNQSALTKHKLTHSDERKFACQQCSKAFKRHDHLTGHMQTHSNRKPFNCTVHGCDKTYCDARSLRRHKENIHHIKPDSMTPQSQQNVYPTSDYESGQQSLTPQSAQPSSDLLRRRIQRFHSDTGNSERQPTNELKLIQPVATGQNTDIQPAPHTYSHPVNQHNQEYFYSANYDSAQHFDFNHVEDLNGPELAATNDNNLNTLVDTPMTHHSQQYVYPTSDYESGQYPLTPQSAQPSSELLRRRIQRFNFDTDNSERQPTNELKLIQPVATGQNTDIQPAPHTYSHPVNQHNQEYFYSANYDSAQHFDFNHVEDLNGPELAATHDNNLNTLVNTPVNSYNNQSESYCQTTTNQNQQYTCSTEYESVQQFCSF